MAQSAAPRVLIVGGGYVGMYTALRLTHRLRRGAVDVTIVDPQSYMTYQPFLPESAAGNLEPRHVVVPLRRVLKHCRVLTGRVESVDHAHHTARFQPMEGPGHDLDYDILVMAPGSIARTMPIPGLTEYAIGFKTLAEAIFLRNQVLARLELAASTTDDALRRRALTFVFIGAGYAGVEAMAELEDMARDAMQYYPHLRRQDMRWVMVEAGDRIMPEVSPDLAEYTVHELEQRAIEVRCKTKVTSMADGCVELSTGERFEAETIVWTAGVKPHPMLAQTDLPLDDKKRLKCTAELRIEGLDDAWAGGDCAAVPDVTSDKPGALSTPTAQSAVREARRLGDNLAAVISGQPQRVKRYRHAYVGSVASLGLHRGVAELYGVKVRGLPAWVIHRTYHLSRMPTTNRKLRVASDWTLALFFKREIVSFGAFASPKDEWESATKQAS